MDPITHALSGAVVARAIVPGDSCSPVSRTAGWALILGSIFPDIDIVANPFDPDHFATIRIHRSVTHSLVCLPVWAVLFGLLAAWFFRWRGIPSPRRTLLSVWFGVGIGLHILFDCITSFGTMVWSPISWTRIQWDWTFIIDLSLTGVLLFFLLLSWVAEPTQHAARRAVGMLALMSALVGLYALGSYTLAMPVSARAVAAVLVLAALPLITTLIRPRVPLDARNWCRIGMLATAAYLGMNAWAHARALEQLREYAAAEHLDVTEAVAVPLPPNLNLWHGFARTTQDVHEWAFSLADPGAAPPAGSVIPIASGDACPAVLWTIPQVRAWMHFSRIPIVVCGHAAGSDSAEFTDLRFARPFRRQDSARRRDAPISFTWRVTFTNAGRVLSEGWVLE